jgi:hypothetical protein
MSPTPIVTLESRGGVPGKEIVSVTISVSFLEQASPHQLGRLRLDVHGSHVDAITLLAPQGSAPQVLQRISRNNPNRSAYRIEKSWRNA